MSENDPEHLLEVQGLRVERGERIIIDNLDWSITSGENWAILGSNGSGKTSLLRAIFGYLPATKGEISVLGKTYGRSEWPKVRNAIGLLSQSLMPRIPNDQPVAEVILSGHNSQLGYWGDAIAEEVPEVKRLLDAMRFTGRGLEPWAILSQGERQRALLARALCGERGLLFLDEPCAGLDPVARENFLGHLQSAVTRGQTPPFVLITHHLEEIIPAVTHVLLLRTGQIVAAGKKADILNTALLGETFGASVEVSCTCERYELKVRPGQGDEWFA
jgi:iron complex transport system ATP-binding protein